MDKLRGLLPSLLSFYGDPSRRAVNERGATLDLGGWQLTATLHALLAVRLWHQERGTGLALFCLSYTVLAVGMAGLIRWRRSVYVKHRELLTSAANAHHTAMLLHLVLRGGLPLFSLHGGRPLRLLGLLAVANSSVLTMIYFTHGRMSLPAMRRLLPLLALQPLARSMPLCRCLLREEGAAAPMHALYQAVAAAHEAPLLPVASLAVVPDLGPLHACLAVNAWLLLAVSVALPLSLLRLMEQRTAAARPPAQHAVAQRAASQLKDMSGVAWPMRAFLGSSLVWCAAELGLLAWQVVGQRALRSTA
ncbi:hybrid sensor histidine kinase response regulator [Chlorella sorokiniana]|uniref:Hybrid sensor histidine kinase response regulator n=1 Tax=Chlorella sorokiniana TaxID=3076 RepID=A0A2P6TL87_CHLSO|nr:hybrid sensor histidine kinase response regulator [Chlorella sorokiniana]|eukprot:PRW45058.1 hybrid sensor histidine kinase response regulator [Chlorella sorokiniana]